MAQYAELHDGTRLEFPDGTAPEIIDRVVKQHLTGQAQPAPAKEDAGTLANLGAGALSGAAQIGATLLSPIDYAARKLGVENEALFPKDRRAAIEEGLRSMGAQPESTAFKVGQFGAEVAGTAGIPAGLGGQVARVLPRLGGAITTGGMGALPQAGSFAQKLANAGIRVASGAIGGGAAAGAVNPESAATGAVIGGAIPGVVQGVKAVAPSILGMTTGAGEEAIKGAYKAGKTGGATAKQFTANLRGEVPVDDVLQTVKDDLAAMTRAKQEQYRKGFAAISNDKSILSFNDIDSAFQSARQLGVGKSGLVKNQGVMDQLAKIADKVNEWKQADPALAHTPEGLDDLKQAIGGLLEKIPYSDATERKAVGSIYQAIKDTISKQAPTYSKVMKDYHAASELSDEISRALSLGNKASADTAMRKLQSLMRNNVQTNYGNRIELARQLEEAGGKEFLPALAGQALNQWTPRGLQRAAALPTAYLGYGAGGLPLAGLSAATSSPRLVGEAAYLAGKVGRAVPASNALTRAMLYQAGQ